VVRVPLEEEYDIAITGGTVLDGIADSPFPADLGIRDDRIAAVGDLSHADAGRVVDARGKRVVPGFIDIHTHSDISVMFHQPMLSMISQGVTTQVVGNCSLSMGLARPEAGFEFERRWLQAHGVDIMWKDMEQHLDVVRNSGVATNYVTLAGHGTIRKRVMGLADRAADRSEIEAMKRELVLAMEQGAWGLSTGLEYTPSGYANLEELVGLGTVLRRFGGIYATHLRNEGDALLEAVHEALLVGELARASVQISHHKAEQRQNWGKVRQTIRMIEEARNKGVDVWLDQYPYTAFMTNLSVQILPRSVLSGTNEALVARLADPTARRTIVSEMLAAHPDWEDASEDGFWGRVEVTVSRAHRELQGRTIAALARELSKPPVEVALDLIVQEKNFVAALNHAISEGDVEFVLRHPLTMIGSDAIGIGPDGTTGEDRVHPRCYGTFPRVLARYVREQRVISEAEAIKKMTNLPARRLGLTDRGVLRVGAFADIVVYDPNAVRDVATYAQPHRPAEGIDTVIVNGRIVWERGQWTGLLPGRVLRRNA